MPSPFSARDARVSGAVDRAFGERFSFEAFTKGADVDLPATADATRIAFEVTGVWEGLSKSDHPAARGVPDNNAQMRAASMPSVSVADDLVWQPRRGDRITRLFDGSVYEISKVLPDGMGRMLIFLTSRK